MSDELKKLPTISRFKSNLKPEDKSRKIFYYGDRSINVIHARLRMRCSPLKSHLCLLMHVIPEANCECGALIESPRHFFLECPFYTGSRNKMIRKIENVTDCDINIILFGIKISVMLVTE